MENYEVGDIVVYRGATEEQVNWGSNDDPRNVLIEGQSYQITDVEIHSWHTKLTLLQITGKFNSAHFVKHDN